MDKKTETIAILFADIAKSTQLYENLGDKVAKQLIDTCIKHLTKVTLDHHGTVVKTIGDEIMCTFPTAHEAVTASIAMHQAIDSMPVVVKPGVAAPNIYIGIQYGSVIMEKGDVFGDAVNVAARMAAFAKQRQVITTEETIQALAPDHGFEVRCIDKTTIKGKKGEISIFEVIWEQHDMTTMLSDLLDPSSLDACMKLQFKGMVLEIDQNHPVATLGRQTHNDIVVSNRSVSRSHARVEYRRGKFVLVDQSSNGTYIIIQNQKKISLKRDETQLLGKGIICLGHTMEPDSPEVIHFSLERES
jgi:class 3 adenylate cyclase